MKKLVYLLLLLASTQLQANAQLNPFKKKDKDKQTAATDTTSKEPAEEKEEKKKVK